MSVALEPLARASYSDQETVKKAGQKAFSRVEGFAVFWISAVSALAAGLWMVFHLGLIQGDAYSRVLNAYYVIYGGGFNLASVGFVWNPLPSYMELPIVWVFRSIWPTVLTYGIAGNIISSIFAGVSAYYMDRILWRLDVGRVTRIVWTLLFAFNPMIWFYGGNGMSEPVMIGTLLAGLEGTIGYIQEERILPLVKAAIWLAAGFLSRYEAVPFAFFLGLAVVVGMMMHGKKRSEIEGAMILLGLPITYAGIWWILANWVIMKNPFYFANSQYSNTAQLKTGAYTTQLTAASNHNLFQGVLAVSHFALLFPPVIFGFWVTILLMIRRRPDIKGLLLIGATMAVPALQAAMLYKGISALWDRYFIMYIPNGFLLLAYILNRVPVKFRSIAAVLFTAVLLWGNVQTLQAQSTGALGHGDSGAFHLIETNRFAANANGSYGGAVSALRLEEFKAIAHYINDHPKMVVLMDTFVNGGVTPFVKRPSQLVITSDQHFQSILKNPLGRVTAFLVPRPLGVASLDAINHQYPTLWAGGVPWTRLLTTFPGSLADRLYQIRSNAP